jgi:hypothetical protein
MANEIAASFGAQYPDDDTINVNLTNFIPQCTLWEVFYTCRWFSAQGNQVQVYGPAPIPGGGPFSTADHGYTGEVQFNGYTTCWSHWPGQPPNPASQGKWQYSVHATFIDGSTQDFWTPDNVWNGQH